MKDTVLKPKFNLGNIYNYDNSAYITLIPFENGWSNWIEEDDIIAIDLSGNMVAFMNERSEWVYSDNEGEEVSETYLELYEKYTDDEIDHISQIKKEDRRPSICGYTVYMKKNNDLKKLN
tara:strand:- start:1602 stop:1961 length:360 start_codon:yes stop_codon:yes gene_type:complete